MLTTNGISRCGARWTLAGAAVVICGGSAWAEPRYAEVVALHAAPLVETGLVPAMVIGICKDGVVEHHALGSLAGGAAPDEHTLFEIGSITKVFTAALLVDAARRGELSIDDPLSKHLPEGVTCPTKDGVEPTLAHLSSHASGLPRLPGNITATSLDDPYASYAERDLWTYLGAATLDAKPGEKGAYSNLGVGLLGTIVARAAGVSYEDAVRARITAPLGLGDTVITRSDEQRARSAGPHHSGGAASTNWHFEALAGAGALWSTSADLLAFAAAQSAKTGTPLDEVFPVMHKPRNPMEGSPAQVGLGWIIAADGRTLVHDGGTNGYRSSLLVDPASGLAVVVLANASEDRVGAVGEKVFQSVAGMQVEPVKVEAATKVDEATLDRLTGTYAHPAIGSYVVTREGGRLMAQLAGQPPFEVFPRTDREFFYRVVEATIKFDVPEAGAASSVTLFQNGMELKFERKP